MRGQSFGRIVKVRVYATVYSDDGNGNLGISYGNTYTEFSSVQPNGTNGFRIKGNVIKVMPTVSFNTNQIKISMWNLGKNSRAIIEAKIGTKIEIFAGYQNAAVRIGSGEILWSRTHKEGPDYITEIIAGDSQSALVNGNINTSFKGSVTYTQVINSLISALAPNGITAGSITGIPQQSLNQGIVLTKSPLIELFEFCRSIGLMVTLVNSQVNIMPIGSDSGSPLIEISVSTGMIGIPEVQPPGVIGYQDVNKLLAVNPTNDIFFTSLLRADLDLGQRVKIISKFINGEYIIASVTQDFDSWEGPFFSKCEAFRPQAGLTNS